MVTQLVSGRESSQSWVLMSHTMLPFTVGCALRALVWASSQSTQVVPSSAAEFLNKIQLTKFLMN